MNKLYLAAEDMKSWDKYSWDNPDPCGGNACCGMSEQVDGQRPCGVGIPSSGLRKGVVARTCGVYLTLLFISMVLHFLAVQGGKGGGKTPNSFWPERMQGHQVETPGRRASY